MSLILEDVINAIPGNGGGSQPVDAYTKAETDALLSLKASQEDVDEIKETVDAIPSTYLNKKTGGDISRASRFNAHVDFNNTVSHFKNVTLGSEVTFRYTGTTILGTTTITVEPTADNMPATKKYVDNQVTQAIADTTKVAELTAEVTLADKTIFRGAEIASITVTLPDNFSDTFLCEIDFSSGEEATAFTIADTVKWTGDDIADGAFVPMTNTRYQAMIFYDGLAFNGVVRGVAL